MSYKTTIELVTPAKAKAWLDSSATINRAISESTVDRYVYLMKTGRWALNGMAIAFNDNGDILNGHHRLEAVIKSGCSIEFEIKRGLDNRLFNTFDNDVKTRNRHDDLKILGEKHGHALGACLAAIHWLKCGHPAPVSNTLSGWQLKADRIDTADLLGLYPGARDSVEEVCKRKRLVEFSAISRVSTLHYLFGEVDSDDRHAFFDMIQDGYGANHQKGHPVAVLVAFHRSEANVRKLKASTLYHYGIWIKTWNAFRTGKSISCLKFDLDKEKLPKII